MSCNRVDIGLMPLATVQYQSRARFLSPARSKHRLCSANHRSGYWSNLPCDWPSTAWAYSGQETESGPRSSISWHSYIVVRYINPHLFRFSDVMLWAGVSPICLISAYSPSDYLRVFMRVCSSTIYESFVDSPTLTRLCWHVFGCLYKAKIKDER